MKEYLFSSDRLGFRHWLDEDLEPFSRMNADPEVMEFFLRPWTLDDSRNFMQRIRLHFEQNGFGYYAVDRLDNQELIGLIGFKIPGFEAPFMPCIEIAWRIKKEEWNKGYATEGAKRCLKFGFHDLGFTEVHSFTSVINLRSERIMQKIGMTKIGEFEHPIIEAGDPLRTHVLYKITKEELISTD